MKKILLAFDGSNFSEGAFEFARRLNEIQPVLVAGAFLPQNDYANLWSYSTAAAAGAMYVPLIEEEDTAMIAANITRFEKLCIDNDIAHRTHKGFYDFVLPELKKESRFADVMIVSGELFYKRITESDQFDYLQEVLHHSECPVLVVPEQYRFPDKNILAYDGSEASVYAIKQFAYIFPELAKNKTVLVYAGSKEGSNFPEESSIAELLTQHFKNLEFYKLDANPKKYFATWMNEKKGAVLVSGSFSRSSLSQMFRKSFVKDILLEHHTPVFIAHK
jgi:nucleotide-binding universal stress UspA family protein